jgi:hypothetical protein
MLALHGFVVVGIELLASRLDWLQTELFQRFGKALRVYSDDITREPLPRRWVDL